MRILVTGITGFVGSFVAEELHRLGHQVRGACLPGDATWRLRNSGADHELVGLDLFQASPASLSALCEGVELCIHCAWYAVPGVYLSSPENITCVTGSLRLFEALQSAGCRRILGLGSCAEYAPADVPIREDHELRPSSLYAASKTATFLMGQQLLKDSGVSFAWARLFYLFGPKEPPGRLVPDIIGKLLQGNPVPLTEGTQIRDYLCVDDAARALVSVALSDLTGAVNIGSGRPVTVRELALGLGNVLGHPEGLLFGQRAGNAFDPKYICADVAKLRTAGNAPPCGDLAEALERTVNWWKNNRADASNFSGPNT